jgi:hypothetical protein
VETKWYYSLRKHCNLLENIFQFKIYKMGHIKEPVGINFTVDPTPLSSEDRKKISEIIAFYKKTGKKIPTQKASSRMKATKLMSRITA